MFNLSRKRKVLLFLCGLLLPVVGFSVAAQDNKPAPPAAQSTRSIAIPSERAQEIANAYTAALRAQIALEEGRRLFVDQSSSGLRQAIILLEQNAVASGDRYNLAVALQEKELQVPKGWSLNTQSWSFQPPPASDDKKPK